MTIPTETIPLFDIQVSWIFLGAACGLVAGIINALAGNGSAITLSFLTEFMGLPGNLANGTNRIGVLAQCTTTTLVFRKHGVLEKKIFQPVFIPTMIGAIIGVICVTNISHEAFEQVFGILLSALLLVVLISPKRWMKVQEGESQLPPWLLFLIYLGLGFYGGFIQMGMGIFFLATMVLLSRYNLTASNAVKSAVVGAYTAVVLLIFQYKGLVDWKLGAAIAIGQGLGGWLSARMAVRFPWMEKVMYALLIAIILTTLFFLYDLDQWLT